MNSSQTVHPSRETLSAYGLGKLDPTESVAVETHIAECKECCETLLDLGNDTFVDLLRRSETAQHDSVTDEGATGPNALDGEAVCELPEELLQHPRYRVIELLSKGGMGDVYKAEHVLMNRPVALKLINRKLIQNSQAVDRFRREVQWAAQLAHPNIVTAHDAEQAGDVHFLVMEYVPGEDLSELVKREGPLDVAQACEYIRQAANGLQHAHARGMVHRDVKPHNLMVTADGQVKILDFGLASLTTETLAKDAIDERVQQDSDGRPARHLTSAGTIMGTPDFISPEQADNAHEADSRSDIYSLGATLYYLLSGRPPFADGSVVQKLRSHAKVEPESLDLVRDDIPAELTGVITRMMAKNPNERFQTPVEVAEALAPFADTKLAVADPVLQTKPRRSRSFSTVGLVLTVIGLTILSVVAYLATNKGTVVIRTEGLSGVQLLIKQDERKERIVVTQSGEDKIPVRLAVGDYEIEILGEHPTLELSHDRLVVRRGGMTVVQIQQLPLVADKGPARPTLRELKLPSTQDQYALSSDGAHVAFTGRDGRLTVRELATGEDTVLGKGWFPVWSPDGKRIAYQEWLNMAEQELKIVTIETRHVQSTGIPGIPKDWSRDGKNILYVVRPSSLAGRPDLPRARIQVLDLANAQPRPVSERRGGAHSMGQSPGFSPDGEYVVFDGGNDGNRDIYVIPVEGGEPMRITKHDAIDQEPHWSPDGKYILFKSNRSTGRWDFWLIPVTDAQPTGEPQLIRPAVGTAYTWSESGHLLFSTGGAISHVYKEKSNPQTGLMEGEPTKQQLTDKSTVNRQPIWSPDGKRIAYTSDRDTAEGTRYMLCVMSADGSDETDLVTVWMSVGTYDWLPDNEHIIYHGIVYEGEPLGKGTAEKTLKGIFAVSTKSKEVQPLYLDDEIMGHVDCSPDGKQLAFIRGLKQTQVYTLDVDAKKLRLISEEEGEYALYPAFSPDGTKLIYAQKKQVGEKTSCRLMIVPLDGGEPKELFSSSERAMGFYRAYWRPSGDEVFVRTRSGGVWAVNPNGSQPRLVVPANESLPLNWSPDGEYALYVSGSHHRDLWLMENFLPPLAKDVKDSAR